MSYEEFKVIYLDKLQDLLKTGYLGRESLKISNELADMEETFPEFTARADDEMHLTQPNPTGGRIL